MPRFLTEHAEALKSAVDAYLAGYIGETVSPIQTWYEAFGGYGTPEPRDMEAIAALIGASEDWEDIGNLRNEKFGVQPSYRRKAAYQDDASQPIRVQHKFKLNTLYQAPDGRVMKAVCCEVYNLRLFEIKDGHMTGPMIKLHPRSELADSLVEVM